MKTPAEESSYRSTPAFAHRPLHLLCRACAVDAEDCSDESDSDSSDDGFVVDQRRAVIARRSLPRSMQTRAGACALARTGTSTSNASTRTRTHTQSLAGGKR